MTTLFLYEYATAQPPEVMIPASVRREGRVMFHSLLEDAGRISDLQVLTLQPSTNEEPLFRPLVQHADVALVIAPEFDGLLETRSRWVEDTGCRLLGPSSMGVRQTADKWALYRHWMAQGVPTPSTWLPDTFPGGERGGRFLQKHRYGAGSLGVAFVNAPDRVPPDHLIQAWVPGVAASLSMIVDEHGKVLPLLGGYQRIANDGSFQYQGGRLPLEEPHELRLLALAYQALAGLPGLQGYVGVDAILSDADDGAEDYVLEINPRITTSYIGLRRATSTNLLEVILRAAQNRPLPEIVWDRLPVEFTAAGEVTSRSDGWSRSARY
jgi:predicted ATP-grasp superfamily ATP-dependent carboligase